MTKEANSWSFSFSDQLEVILYTVPLVRCTMLMKAGDIVPITNPGIVGLSQLAKIFPLPVVQQVLEELGSYTCRLRELPNEMMVYFPMMMAFDRDDSASETLRRLLEGHEGVFGRRTDKVTGKAGISKARIRVGSEPLKQVFDLLCQPLVQGQNAYSHFDGLRMVAIDGVLLNVPDTQQNSDFFGRSTNQYATTGSYPKSRVVALVECGTHAVFAAKIGGYHDSEVKLAKDVLQSLDKNMLVIADRLFFGWELFNAVRDAGAKILWRFKEVDRDKLEIGERLPDGSYTATYHAPRDFVSKSPKGTVFNPIPVRVCSYSVEGAKKEDIHIVTTLLDHEKAPAVKLAELYMQRWEIELVFREMKVELNKNAAALRSGTPELVRQELYGLLMTHYAIRSLIYEAATRAKLDPDVISFKGTVRAIRRKSQKGGDFPP